MNPFIVTLAKELAHQINGMVNIPFVSEEEEELFFQLVITKVLELTVGSLLRHLEKKNQ